MNTIKHTLLNWRWLILLPITLPIVIFVILIAIPAQICEWIGNLGVWSINSIRKKVIIPLSKWSFKEFE